ncbi:MAG: helix-turn-helix domain-containing protein [Nitrospirales bacterium]
MDTKRDDDVPQEFMTAGEVAAWLRIALSTVYAWTASGRIPCVKFNGVVRFHRTQLSEWVSQHATSPNFSSVPRSERISGACPRRISLSSLKEAALRVKRRL